MKQLRWLWMHSLDFGSYLWFWHCSALFCKVITVATVGVAAVVVCCASWGILCTVTRLEPLLIQGSTQNLLKILMAEVKQNWVLCLHGYVYTCQACGFVSRAVAANSCTDSILIGVFKYVWYLLEKANWLNIREKNEVNKICQPWRRDGEVTKIEKSTEHFSCDEHFVHTVYIAPYMLHLPAVSMKPHCTIQN